MELETERLILRKFDLNDIEDYWEYVSMPSVGPRAGWPAYTDKDKALERLKVEAKKENQFAIFYKQDSKVIGSIELMNCKVDRYSNLEVEKGAKEIGFVLSEKYWNKGIATEATKEVMRYAFEDLKVDVIYIGHASINEGSKRVQEKLGFKIVGKRTDYITWIDGTQTDYIERKMTRDDYLKLKGENNE